MDNQNIIISKIKLLRGVKVLLDSDLAELYEVSTKRLNEQVKRNAERFPADFMFQLTKEEFENLRSQFATSSWGGRRRLPYAFTEHGVLMLSSVLKSKKATEVNIHIMRIFTSMRKLLLGHQEMVLKIEKIERNLDGQSHEIKVLFSYLKKLMTSQDTIHQQKSRQKIGFKK